MLVPAMFHAIREILPKRRCRTFALSLLSLVGLIYPCDAREPESVAERVAGRTFPSVFQAWNRADNLGEEDRWATVARHDLVFHAPDFFGLVWQGEPKGMATAFTPQSVTVARKRRDELRRRNPNIVLLAEVRYRDAPREWLPADSPWWRRDEKGKRIVGWAEGDYLLLDTGNADVQAHVARQAKSLMESGALDGIMFDWWDDSDDRLALVRAVRKAIGDDPLILVNGNDHTTPRTAEYVNGLFMECYRTATPQDWRRVEETLRWAETHLRKPRINCLETWYRTSRKDLHLMRATTALSMVSSDGYCLFSDPNDLPTADHLHDWYPFWDQRIGRPVKAGESLPDGSTRREFEKGIALYNPAGNQRVAVTFPSTMTRASTAEKGRSFDVEPEDGELFLRNE